jgi:DNA polymerase-4
MTELHICHADMNYFFAQCELMRYPELVGQAVVIGGRKEHAPYEKPDGSRVYSHMRNFGALRGVVTTATYEARAFGIKSGMPMSVAARLAPEAICLPTDFQLYRKYSNAFKAAIATIAAHIEDVGIDEVYIDISGVSGEPRDIAQRIKDAVHAATGLTCSIGLSYCKRIAKIASDLQKPNGLTVVTREDVPRLIWPLHVREVNGIGPKAVEKLKGLHITTIGELACADAEMLQQHFGRTYAAWLLDAANGIDDRPVVTHWEPKQMSREITFDRDLHPRADREALSFAFTELCTRVAQELQHKEYVGKTIGIKIRYSDFITVTRDYTLGRFTDDASVIRRAAGKCLKRVPLDKTIRLLGVRITGLMRKENAPPPEPLQRDLFDTAS